MDDWSKQFESLLTSPLGVELIYQLNFKKGLLQDEAANAKTQEDAFALLKEASGVIKAIEHLQFLSVTNGGKGSKN